MLSEEGPPPARSRGHVRGLDGIRGLSIGLVLFAHSVIHGEFSHLSPVGMRAGPAGVAIFFVLSGYLITTLLLREERQTGSISLRLFYIRRGLRLFPALWLYLLVVAVLTTVGWLPSNPWHSFVSSLFYFRNIVGRGDETGHLWSLSLEEQFYIFWPLVLVAFPRRDRIRLAVALLVLISVTLWRIYAAENKLAWPSALYMRSDFRFDSPLFGCAIALAERIVPRAIAKVNFTPLRSDVMTAVGLIGLALWVGTRLDEVVLPGAVATVTCLFGVILVLSQVGAEGHLSGSLASNPLVVLGQVSYGVYIWHQLFIGPPTGGFERIRSFPLGLLATFAVAVASYWCLERPILRLKDRYFQSSVSGRKAVLAGPTPRTSPAAVCADGSGVEIIRSAPI